MFRPPPNVPAVFWSPALAAYDMGTDHSMRPERAAMAVGLMGNYGLFDSGLLQLRDSYPMRTRDLLLVHDQSYLEQLRVAGNDPAAWSPGVAGINTPDVPAFPDMLDASAAICGASSAAVATAVLGKMAFSPAGGMHHAHRRAAAGFCVLNDAAAAIAVALRDNWALRIAYVDIDAHHGDGVQEAFWDEPRVLTLSMHGSGHHLYPGRGFANETGGEAAPGSAANLGLPQGADDACYRLGWERFAAPLLRAWRPDVIVAQFGADALVTDTITVLGLTLRGYEQLTSAVISLARSLCGGRLAALGGGGYGQALSAPRAWTMAAATMAGVRLPDRLPPEWLPSAREDLMSTLGLEWLPEEMAAEVRETVDSGLPHSLRDDGIGRVHFKDPAVLLEETRQAVDEARAAVFPFWGLLP